MQRLLPLEVRPGGADITGPAADERKARPGCTRLGPSAAGPQNVTLGMIQLRSEEAGLWQLRRVTETARLRHTLVALGVRIK